MEMRRRIVETVRAADDAEPLTTKTSEGEIVKNALLEEGCRLYAEAEQSGFQNTAVLENGLRCFLRATAQGVNEAADWTSSFLDSTPALPPAVLSALQPSLLRLLHWARSATTEEKAVYLVAEEMFRTMSHGTSAIARSEVDGAVMNLLTGRCEDSAQVIKSAKGLRMSVKRMLSSALESSNSTEVTLDMFCDSAVTYARGVLPHEDSELTAQQRQDFKEANILKKVTNYPLQTAQYYKRSMLKLIERRGVKWIWSSFPTKQFHLLLLAYFLPMISANFILSSVATIVFVAAFIAMCVGTLQVVLAAEKVCSFIEYSSIFQYFSETKINTRKPEMLLIRRSGIPFVTFALSFCVTLLSFYLSHQSLVPNEVLCIVSAFFSLAVFLQFECYKSSLFLVSSSSRLLSWLHVSLVAFQEVFPIPDFLLYIGSAALSLPILPGLTLKLNALTLVQFPVQCVLIAYFLVHYKWRNVYSGLGPYLLFTSWLVMSRHFFTLSSPLYILLGVIGIVAVLAIAPFLPILFVVSPMYVLFYYGLSIQFFTCLGVVGCFVLLLIILRRYSKQLLEAKWLNISFDYLILLQILISIPAIFIGASWVSQYYTPTNVPVVSLAQYSEYCGPQNWAGNNMVQTQLNCQHLRDRVVTASGVVEAVKISEVSNDREHSLQSLPSVIRAALTCLLGRLDPMCGRHSDMETCRREEFTGCHFHHSHRYTSAIEMNVTLPPLHESKESSPHKVSVTLLASNIYTEFVTTLKSGDSLRFNATFVSGMGSDKLVLQLTALQGMVIGRVETVEDSVQLIAQQIVHSLTNTLTILFDVLLGYTRL